MKRKHKWLHKQSLLASGPHLGRLAVVEKPQNIHRAEDFGRDDFITMLQHACPELWQGSCDMFCFRAILIAGPSKAIVWLPMSRVHAPGKRAIAPHLHLIFEAWGRKIGGAGFM